MNPLPLVIAELRRNALGCTAIIALIAIATALGVVVSAAERGVRDASNRAASRFDLIVGAAGSPTQLVLTTVYLQPAALDLLPASTLERLQHEHGVAAIAPVAVTDSYSGHMVVGTTAAFAGASGLAAGRMFTGEKEAVIGSAVDIPLGERLQPAHGSPAENLLEARAHAAEFTVVGRINPTGTPWDRAIVIPIEAVWSMHGESTGQARVPAIVVRPETVADAYRLRTAYRGAGSVALFPAEVLLPIYALLGDVRDLLRGMAFAFQGLLGVAVLLVMIATLANRRHGIGVLRALGAPPRFVVAAVWLEGAGLIFAGVVIGGLVGAAALHAVSHEVSARTGLAVEATFAAAEYSLLGALVLGGAALASLPSLALLRVSVVKLLR